MTGRQTVLYSKEQLECVELCHEMVHKQDENLQVRIKGRISEEAVVMAFRNPDQGVK